MLNDPETKQAALNEIRRRLPHNVVNRLVFRCLMPVDDVDEQDALDGLAACCWKALGGLRAPDTSELVRTEWLPKEKYDERGNMRVRWHPVSARAFATQKFITDFILERLCFYFGLSMSQIGQKALAGEFRWLARNCRHRLIDKIRRSYGRKESRQPAALSLDRQDLDPALYELRDALDTENSLSLSLESIRNRITADRDKLIEQLGQREYETLRILLFLDPAEYAGSKRAVKGRLTEAVAKARGTGLRQARSAKARLFARLRSILVDKYLIQR